MTNFPYERARLTAFWWGYANGSIVPFLNKFGEYASKYRVPEKVRGYDATGPQKYMAEWAQLSGEETVVPLGFEAGKKFEYLNAAKVLMSKGLIQAPKGISGFERQLRDYRLPDKKIAQDTVSTFCMACYLMFPLYREAYPEAWDDSQTEEMARLLTARSRRDYRPPRDRSSGRSRSLLPVAE